MPIEKELKKVYRDGKKERRQKAYQPLILFKMQLMSIWYDLSDMQTEDTCNDCLSVMKFFGLTLEDSVKRYQESSKVINEDGTKRIKPQKK